MCIGSPSYSAAVERVSYIIIYLSTWPERGRLASSHGQKLGILTINTLKRWTVTVVIP